MKKFISPLIVFAGAFTATLLFQKYTFAWQEYEGLFLWSADYFSSMFQKPWPVSGIIGDWLTQFFRFGVYAPLTVGLGVMLAFILVRSILGRFSLGHDVFPAIASCGFWLFVAFAPTAKRGVAAILIIFGIWILSRLLPSRQNRNRGWIFTLAITAGTFLFLFLSTDISEREANAELCTATAMADWDRVLTVATPEACEKDRSMMPFAFLALGEKGQLGNRLFNYPVQSQRDFDMSGIEDSYPTLFFKGCLYQALSCPNESMHNFFQLATLQEHGQSFLVIRHLIADCFLNGDYDLVKKYCSVLSRSTLHSQYVKYFLGLTEKGTPHAPDSVTFRKTVPLISQDPLYNLFLFEGTGMHSVSSMDRLLCTLLIQRQPERFRDLFMSVKHMYPIIPRYYEEALVIAGGADNLISTSTSKRYSDLQWDPDTYWFYYMSGN